LVDAPVTVDGAVLVLRYMPDHDAGTFVVDEISAIDAILCARPTEKAAVGHPVPRRRIAPSPTKASMSKSSHDRYVPPPRDAEM
jgi:hypothetical protein